eukprot:3246-Heterococcus_DN1.PRE.3
MYTLSNLQRCGFTQHMADGALWSYYNKGRRYYSKNLTSYTSGDDDAAASVASETTDEPQDPRTTVGVCSLQLALLKRCYRSVQPLACCSTAHTVWMCTSSTQTAIKQQQSSNMALAVLVHHNSSTMHLSSSELAKC